MLISYIGGQVFIAVEEGQSASLLGKLAAGLINRSLFPLSA
jgi:hypothetical protein